MLDETLTILGTHLHVKYMHGALNINQIKIADSVFTSGPSRFDRRHWENSG